MKHFSLISLITIFTCLTFPLLAQENEEKEEDPYSEYSYLWDTDPKKKKKKDKSKKDEPTTSTSNETTPQTGVPADSISSLPVDSLESDGLSNQNVTQPLDTIPDDPIIPQDTIPDTPVQTQPLDTIPDEEPTIEEPKKEKEKDKKERKSVDDGPAIEDFRAPLSSEVGGNKFLGGLSFTQIGDENFVGLVLAPEFAFNKVGVGLNIPILYGLESNEVRTEIFEDGAGVARLIRYIRYGRQKRDPFYIRVGELQGIMMGFGGLINNYTNTTNYEKRKVGIHFDYNYDGLAGIEGMYSDIDPSSRNLLGIRPYVRPLSKMPIPIARTLEIGASFVSDKDQTDLPTSVDSVSYNYAFTRDGISGFGLDMGITVLRIPFIQIDVFANYGNLNVESDTLRQAATSLGDSNFENGSGFSFGANFRMHFIADLFSTDVRIERLSYSKNYLPQFFDASYEFNKDLRLLSLANAEKMGGIYGSLTGHIVKKIQLGGSLLIPDDMEATPAAVIRLNADLDKFMEKYSINASYIKSNLGDLGDAFKLDERSLAKVRFTYQMNKILALGVEYYYFWELIGENQYEASKFVMPYFGVNIDF